MTYKDPEKEKRYQKLWRQNHKEGINKTQRRRYWADVEKNRAYQRQWQRDKAAERD